MAATIIHLFQLISTAIILNKINIIQIKMHNNSVNKFNKYQKNFLKLTQIIIVPIKYKINNKINNHNKYKIIKLKVNRLKIHV